MPAAMNMGRDAGATVADKLREARALIERGWTQRYFARDERGKPCPLGEGSSFCSLGATWRVSDDEIGYQVLDKFVERAIGGANVEDWNDDRTRTREQVLAAFDKAIEIAEARQ